MAGYSFRSVIAQESRLTTASLPESRFNSRVNLRPPGQSSTAHLPIGGVRLRTAILKRCRFTLTRHRCFRLAAAAVALAEVVAKAAAELAPPDDLLAAAH